MADNETTDKVSEPYSNVPPDKVGDMDACKEKVMAQGHDEKSAIAICYASVVEGKDLDEVMRTFKLDVPVSPDGETAPVAEAATVKSKVRAAIKALDELLGERTLPEALRATVKDIREKFKTKTWADLAAEIPDSERQSENEPQTSPTSTEHFAESYGGAVMLEEAQASVSPARAPLNLPVQLIRPGWGNARDSHYYTPEVIKAAEPLFVGRKMYATDHNQAEKNVMTEVAVINKIQKYTDDGSPIADVTIFSPDFAEMVRARKSAGQIETLECSVLGNGTARPFEKDGRKGKLVESITDIESVDFVTRAGAGGKALDIAESDPTPKTEGGSMPDKDKVIEVTPTPETSQAAPVAEQAANPAPAEPIHLSELEVTALLEAEKRLPAASRARLAKGQYDAVDKVKEAAQAELAYLAEALGSGEPFGLGASKPAPKKTPTEAQAAFNEAWDKVNKSKLS